MKKNFIFYTSKKGCNKKIILEASLFLLLFLSCESRSEFIRESRSDIQQSLKSEEIKEKPALNEEEELLARDTIVYEKPQVPGSFLSAPEDIQKILWGNKNDKPVKTTDSNVALLSFIIEPDSTVSSVRVLKGINAKMDSIAVQSVKKSIWKPGYINNNPIRSRFVFPIVF